MNKTPRIAKESRLPVGLPALLKDHQAADFNLPPLPYMEEIHKRADAMTPLLKEILDFRPSPHWK